MAIDPKLNAQLHKRLPIGDDEEILGVFRHHWFVYVSIWFIGFFAVIAIMASAVAFTAPTGDIDSTANQSFLVHLQRWLQLFQRGLSRKSSSS